MKILAIVCRVLLGLLFVVGGVNHLVPFIHMPPPPPNTLPGMFYLVFEPTHWMFVVGVFELLGGVLVLIGGTAPVGLAILAPIIVNILLYSLLLAGGRGLSVGIVLGLLEAVLLYAYRANFSGLLTVKARPA